MPASGYETGWLCRGRGLSATAWPGEPLADTVEDIVIGNRDEDFVQFVVDDVASRRNAEAAFSALVDSR
jgi:hypothetical protein